MTWDDFTKIAAGLLALLTAALQVARAREGGRAGIRQDVELLKGLQPGSEAHRALAKHVDARVLALVRQEEGARRDWNGVTAAVFCLGIAILAGVPALRAGSLWRWLGLPVATLFLLVALYGAIVSIPKRHRDAKGNPIKTEPPPLR